MNKRFTKSRILIIVLLSVAVSSLHFFTPTHLHHFHLIYDRLCYFPIILAAFWFGFWGGFLTGCAMAIMHLSHIGFQWGGNFFEANLYQTLEVFVHFFIGLVTGYLSERFLRTSEKLDQSYRELREKTEQVLNAEEQLRRTERIQALAELSAGIAHELRTPISAIKGASEILTSSRLTQEQRKEFSDILKKETKHLNSVVDEFLNFARPKTPKPVLCDINQITESVLDLTSQQMKNRNIQFHKEYSEEPVSIVFDPGQLKQVVANLILNAIQAMSAGGALSISTKNTPFHILFIIEDTGKGIPDDVITRIFNPFFTTRQNGTGLGLSIVHKILTHHGASIEAVNKKDGGARFTIRFKKEREPAK